MNNSMLHQVGQLFVSYLIMIIDQLGDVLIKRHKETVEPAHWCQPSSILQIFHKFKQKFNQFKQATFIYYNIMQKEKSGVLKNSLQNIRKRKDRITSVPLIALKPIKIKDLVPGTTHVGSLIQLEILSVCKKKEIQITCRDDEGSQIMVFAQDYQLYNQSFSHYFSRGRSFYIKQPFASQDEIQTLIVHVDNIYDIIFLIINFSSQSYRQIGKQLVELEYDIDAYCLYNEAIKNYKDNKNTTTFLLNKAIMSLKYNLKEEYGQCIRMALQRQPNNEKAHFHLIKYETILMNNLTQDKFQLLRQKVSNSTLLKQQSKKSLMEFISFHETFQKNTKINWYKAFQTQKLGQFFSPKIKIGKSPYGRGIFAAKDILQGEILIIEHPTLLIHKTVLYSHGNFDKDCEKIMTQLFSNSEEFRHKIYSYYPRNKLTLKQNEEVGFTFENVRQIMRYNSYVCGPNPEFLFNGLKAPTHTGLYDNFCLINHQCDSNCHRFFIGNTAVVYAHKQIKANQELFVDYTCQDTYDERTEILKLWDIKCKCSLCDEQLRQKKGEYIAQYTSKKHRVHFLGMNMLSINNIEALKAFEVNLIKNLKDSVYLQSITTLNAFGEKYTHFGDKILAKVFPMNLSDVKKLRERGVPMKLDDLCMYELEETIKKNRHKFT